MEDEQGEDRISNVLRSCVKVAKNAYAETDPTKKNDRLSYLIGALETATELVRPDDYIEEPPGENKLVRGFKSIIN